jgi:hypothetical protein
VVTAHFKRIETSTMPFRAFLGHSNGTGSNGRASIVIAQNGGLTLRLEVGAGTSEITGTKEDPKGIILCSYNIGRLERAMRTSVVSKVSSAKRRVAYALSDKRDAASDLGSRCPGSVPHFRFFGIVTRSHPSFHSHPTHPPSKATEKATMSEAGPSTYPSTNESKREPMHPLLAKTMAAATGATMTGLTSQFHSQYSLHPLIIR